VRRRERNWRGDEFVRSLLENSNLEQLDKVYKISASRKYGSSCTVLF
jgi:hypothetical protein